jgi:hypothetical protein
MASVGSCALCERETARTFHHLIPRTLHRNKWFQKRYTREQLSKGIDVCQDCHSAIHRYIHSEKELGRHYNSIDSLKSHEQLAQYLQWISGRDPSSRVRTAPPGGRKRRGR